MTGCVHIARLVPQLIQQSSVLRGKFTLSAQGIIVIDLLSKVLIKEVLCEWPCIAEALQGTVHKACVAKVGQPNDAPLGILLPLHFHGFGINDQFSAAFVEMISLIVLLTLLRAILDFFANAGDLKDMGLVAALTFAVLPWVLIIRKDKWALGSFNFDHE